MYKGAEIKLLSVAPSIVGLMLILSIGRNCITRTEHPCIVYYRIMYVAVSHPRASIVRLLPIRLACTLP
jgi:hypothetical protein